MSGTTGFLLGLWPPEWASPGEHVSGFMACASAARIVVIFSCVQLFVTHGLQHARFPCPPLSPRVCSNSCPLSRWCHPTISSSVTPFSSCPQSFPASVFSNESALPIRWPKYWSFSISPSNEYSILGFGQIVCQIAIFFFFSCSILDNFVLSENWQAELKL